MGIGGTERGWWGGGRQAVVITNLRAEKGDICTDAPVKKLMVTLCLK